MNCEELRERLGDPTTLPAIETDDEAMRHIAGCEPCRAWLTYEKQLANGFAQIGNRCPPVALADRIIAIPAEARRRAAERTPWWLAWWRRSWWPAALAGGVVGLFFALSVSWLTPASPRGGPTLQAPPAPLALARREETAKSAPLVDTEETAAPLPAAPQAQESLAPLESSSVGQGPGAPTAAPPKPGPDVSTQPGGSPPTAVALMAAATEEATAKPAGASAVFEVARLDPGAPDLETKPLLPPPALPMAMPRPAASPAPAPPVPPVPAVARAREAPLPDEIPVRQSVALDSARVPAPAPKEAEGFDAESLPIVRGEPLDADALRPRPLPAVKPALPAPKARVQLAPAGPTDPFAPKIRPGPSATRGELLLAKGTGEALAEPLEREGAADRVAKDERQPPGRVAPFAAPPPAAAPTRPTLAFKKELPSARVVSLPRDQRNTKVEAVLEAHSREVKEGPIDINHWVINDWISLKERIFLAPPPGYHWVAIRRGSRWEASLQKISGP